MPIRLGAIRLRFKCFESFGRVVDAADQESYCEIISSCRMYNGRNERSFDLLPGITIQIKFMKK